MLVWYMTGENFDLRSPKFFGADMVGISPGGTKNGIPDHIQTTKTGDPRAPGGSWQR